MSSPPSDESAAAATNLGAGVATAATATATATATAAAATASATTTPKKQQDDSHPEDDDVLLSIRVIRRMVEQEFGTAKKRRKRRCRDNNNNNNKKQQRPGRVLGDAGTKQPKQRTAPEENNHDDDDDDDDDEHTGDNHGLDTWKNQCFRLKQELFEERKRATEKARDHKTELAKAQSNLREARQESIHDRDIKLALVETLEAQTNHSKGISRQLAESRENSKTLRVMWKDLVGTMEDEKESMDKERETSLRLLGETQHRLASAIANHQQREAEARCENEKLASRVKELEESRARLLVPANESKQQQKQQQQSSLSSSSSSLSSLAPGTTATTTTTTTARANNRSKPGSFYWNKSKIMTLLQQKLRELEESLARDAVTIRLLERQITEATTTTTTKSQQQNESKATKHTSGSMVLLQPSSLASKKIRLRETKDHLRKKSLGVLGDVILLQLQRLMEIHRQTTSKNAPPPLQTTTETTTTTEATSWDEEWESILQKLSQNRARIYELRKEVVARDDSSSNNSNTTRPSAACGIGDRGSSNTVAVVRTEAGTGTTSTAFAETKKRGGCDQEQPAGGSIVPSKRAKTD